MCAFSVRSFSPSGQLMRNTFNASVRRAQCAPMKHGWPFTTRMLLPQGIRRITLVTDAWHMERARFAFAREGIEVYCAPTNFPDAVNIHSMALWMPRGQAFVENQFGLSELVGQVKYHVMPRAGSSAPAPAPLSDPAPGTKTRP